MAWSWLPCSRDLLYRSNLQTAATKYLHLLQRKKGIQMTDHYICVHGHFYQPPRENPWLEEVELQESAHPFHDWNERICAECYAPNTASRILDQEGRIIDIVNNYSKISFNFGPTLL